MSTDSRAPRTAAGQALATRVRESVQHTGKNLSLPLAVDEGILAIEAEAAADPVAGEALRLVADLIEYADALLGADLSYTELDPATDKRAAQERWPLNDSRTIVESVIEANTWRAELDEYRSRLATLPTPVPEEGEGDE